MDSLWAMELGRVDLTLVVGKKAARLAYAYKATVYDALFLALAYETKATLLTADQAFFKKLQPQEPVLLLRDFKTDVP